MIPSARTTRSQAVNTTDQTASPNPAPATSKGRGRKRKSPADTDNSVPASAPAKRPANAKAKPNASNLQPSMSATRSDNPIDNAVPDQSAGRVDPNGEVEQSVPAAEEPTAQQTDPTILSLSTNTQPASEGSNPALAARLAALEKENLALKKYKVMAVKLQKEKNAIDDSEAVPDASVPRPPGERGKNGWNMQTALQLELDGDKYNAILATTRHTVWQVGLDWKLKFDEQDPARVGTCYSQMKHTHPYLKRFKNDWACRELVIGTLQNRRKVENAKVKAAADGFENGKPKSKRLGFKPRPKSKKHRSEENQEPVDIQELGGEGGQAEGEAGQAE